ncbi:orotidine-5'-phosphate decarboxylase [Microbacterium excoecariae]|uniref:orotidine-5'-phosphate decarboxylase n=1 Tax=Microbacterium excoecariae TaxID=2715210 RepID=UPI0030B89449|nr:orotidine-5'-phosphate decarboxylase [Microbacterium excoecariae]
MTVPFGERVRAGLDRRGPLCVGIDPHPGLLAEWGLPESGEGVREFGLRVVAAAAERVAVVKPQVSFFERWGSEGLRALEDVSREARAAGLLVIADAKRGDIGSTMDAYAQAWLTPGAALEADALTVSPYLGVGSLAGTIERAYDAGKGVFVLAATSNPESRGLQSSVDPQGRTVSQRVIDEVSELNARHVAGGQWASAGFVVGATVDWRAAGIARSTPPAPLLAPGFGHQGARPDQLGAIFGEAAPTVLVSESRSILSAGPVMIDSVIEEHADAARAARTSAGRSVPERDGDE